MRFRLARDNRDIQRDLSRLSAERLASESGLPTLYAPLVHTHPGLYAPINHHHDDLELVAYFMSP